MLTKLTGIQEEHGFTDAVMARRLGIARSTWTDIRNGKLAISAKVQMRAAREFPELLGDLLMQVSNGPDTATPREAA